MWWEKNSDEKLVKTKLKNSNSNIIKNSNCDKTQKLKLWQNSKSKMVTKLKNFNGDKTQKLKLWHNLSTQIVTKLKNSSCDKT